MCRDVIADIVDIVRPRCVVSWTDRAERLLVVAVLLLYFEDLE